MSRVAFFNLCCQRDVIDYHHTVSSSSLRDDDESDDGESDIARASATPVVVVVVVDVVVVETRVHGGAFARHDVDVNSRRSCTSR